MLDAPDIVPRGTLAQSVNPSSNTKLADVTSALNSLQQQMAALLSRTVDAAAALSVDSAYGIADPMEPMADKVREPRANDPIAAQPNDNGTVSLATVSADADVHQSGNNNSLSTAQPHADATQDSNDTNVQSVL